MKPFIQFLSEQKSPNRNLLYKNTRLAAEKHGYNRYGSNGTFIKQHADTPNKYHKVNIDHEGSWKYYHDSRDTDHDNEGKNHQDLLNHFSKLTESAYDRVASQHGYKYDPEDTEGGHTWRHPQSQFKLKLHKGEWKHMSHNNELLHKGDTTDLLDRHLADKKG